jgi:PqqD family protein of HPr-rel-A system
MAAGPAFLWQLSDPAQTRVARFEDGALIFNPVSWETHLVAAPAIRVVEALARGPLSETELAARVADGEDDPARSAGVLDHVRTVLEELERLGLVFSGPQPP